ncbi:MAG: chemotaxis protein CheW [Gaiellales bacterium]
MRCRAAMLAAELLTQARRRAGFSQRGLARAAGTSQAMVARVEAGRQSPSLTTLERLVRACGLRVSVGLAEAESVAASVASAGRQADRFPAGGRVLRCLVAGEEFALPLGQVREVTAHVHPRRLPGQPDWMAGIAFVRGEAVPVIDAAGQLGLEPAVDPESMVVLDLAAGPAAIIVDRVSGIDSMPDGAVREPPVAVGAARHVAGIAELDGRLVVVLRPSAFLAGQAGDI